MPASILQLGRESELCLAELIQAAKLQGLLVSSEGEGLARLEGLGDQGAESGIAGFCERLGGTIRAVRPLAEQPLLDQIPVSEQPAPGLPTAMEQPPPGLPPVGGRSRIPLPRGPWALSALSEGLAEERERLRAWIRQGIESDPEAHGREERAAPGEVEVVPAKVFHLIRERHGLELCLWKDRAGEVRIGQTAWIYSPDDFAERDVGKPHRPRRRGLLPPKLARQMVNLAAHPGATRLLDPFCGAGAVLIEGMLLGYQVAGSDLREEALDQSRENLDWFLKRHSRDPARELPGYLFLKRFDVRKLSRQIDPLSFDMVVGEGDLGPPIRGALPRKAAVEHAKALEGLYVTAFAEIRIILKPGGRVCLAVPFWHPSAGEAIHLNLERRLALAGYVPVFKERGYRPILYRRKDQRVGRAIYVLESPA
ncbi:MAG: hypothetical protein HUU16_20670 [Candidatus Omnitrophica bacterium]|nr:hypothetical protein [Candidatus Omnitrophota bacterium]